MKKQVCLFNDNFKLNITDIPNLIFLDYVEEDVDVNSSNVEINGIDGVLKGPTTFGSFNLTLNFAFKGTDKKDLRLVKQRLRKELYRREPFYIWHSDAPGKKYAVYCDANENEDLTNSFATFKVTFVVFKGYSESLDDTGKFSLSNGRWQFETGILANEDIKYNHSTNEFKIYNGSDDKIDPLLRHELKIKININAPNGFKVINNTTGDVFEYKKAIKKNQQLIINGVHPFIEKQRVGINTNWQWITLEQGFNDIEIVGENITEVKSQWIFPFIFR
ncbi:phage tail domain-containing protein [Staphylococcus simiae]|uniref:Siphovirus-type tail component RIFT-related domain-containing protein n=1 Tax=Staphylococcus simiae CCM 7213 = CCUG 51256 TaxID=911238 RepID=G5JH95_9STAP|nr:phage tail domain-containing protein [Staphylococcus simiae]EHJ08443.1 hypothetical protein SS7213T_04120 [Staphylococcus simiae CCM 7213 = CCUG 51256]PNZ12547.1 phage tail family protein [Staphylococcus simiae]SNV67431.1 phage tail family protein [Staphylococcus simiae]